MDGTHSCGPHCERVPCLKRRIEELQFELSSYEESDANLQKKVKELEAENERLREERLAFATHNEELKTENKSLFTAAKHHLLRNKELEAEVKQLRKLNDNLERQFVEDTATLLGFD